MRAESSCLCPGVGVPRLGGISFHALVEDVALSMFLALTTCRGWSRTRAEGGAPAPLPSTAGAYWQSPRYVSTVHLTGQPPGPEAARESPGHNVLRKDLP